MCGVEQVIEESFYPKEAANRQSYEICLNLGDELSERILIGYQDTSKVAHFYVGELGGK